VRFGTTDSSTTKGNYLDLGAQSWFGKESPAFTSNTAVATNFKSYGWDTNAGWVVSVSSVGGLIASNAFNKTTLNDQDCWLSDNIPTAISPEWIRIKYPIPTIIRSYSITSRNRSDFTRFPTSWKLQGSADETIWVDLESTRTESAWNSNTTKIYNTGINITNTPYTYYQLLIENAVITTANQTSGLVAIGDWSLYTNPAGFTTIGVIRFWQIRTWQRWFDFGNGAGLLNIFLAKVGTTNIQSQFTVLNTISNITDNTVPIGNDWCIVIARLTNASLLESWANPSSTLNPRYATTGTITDYAPRRLTNNWIGRSASSGDSYACLDIRETHIYDYALSDTQLKNFVISLRAKYGYDPRLPTSGRISFNEIRSLVPLGSKISVNSNNLRSITNTVSDGSQNIAKTSEFSLTNLYGVGYSGYPTSIPNLYAWYTPQSWSTTNNRWEDISGNSRHTILTKGSITVGNSTDTNGRTIQCLIGSTTAGVRFPTTVLPTQFTLFHLTRYTGGTRGRIFDGIGVNYTWFDGFHINKSGVSYRNAQLTPQLDVFVNNWVLSSSQNNIYRANGIQQNNAIPTGLSAQITINYGDAANVEPSDWACAEVIVYNRLLSIQEINLVEQYIRNKHKFEPQYGLDALSSTAKTNMVAAYSFQRAMPSYFGPTVRVRRSTDNIEIDFYATITGVLYAGSINSGVTLSSWLGTSTGYIRTWYDQSGRSKHIEQATVANQPTIVLSADGNTCLYLTGSTLFLQGPNVFDTTTVSNMHWVFSSKEVARTSGFTISLNGTDTGNRFTVEAPNSSGLWYADYGDVETNRSTSGSIISTVMQTVVFSGYKSSTEVKNGFRLNGGTRYLSSGNTAATVLNGIRLGNIGGTVNHQLQSLFIFKEKLQKTDEEITENYAALYKPLIFNNGAIDSNNNIVAAYALRRLFTGYYGPQIRVKRSDNNVQTNIFYDKLGVVSSVEGATSLTAFAGTAQLYVVTWYDQSGKGNHGTAVSNPTLDYTTNTLKHSINLATNSYITIVPTTDLIINASTTPFWAYMAFTGTPLSSPNTILSRDITGSGTTDYRFWYSTTGPQWTYGTGAAANTNAWMSTGINGGNGTPCVMAGSHLPLSNTKGFYLNGPNGVSSSAFRNTTGKAVVDTSVVVQIGKNNFVGKVFEILIYRTDMTGTSHNFIMNNLSTRYL
jgi:hypothetical protein